jgi:uncharacterized protein
MSLSPQITSTPLEKEFSDYRCWAVVGVSSDQHKYGNKIYRQLKEANYTVYPVHPKLTEVEGDRCYASLKALPVLPDVVNLVIPPQATKAVIQECLDLGIRRVWFQPGAEEVEAVALAKSHGLEVLVDACILLNYKTWND